METILPFSLDAHLSSIRTICTLLTKRLAENQSWRGFPPMQQPWRIPWWLLTVHAGRGFAWPVGDNHFGSSLTFLLRLSGLVIYWRRGNRWIWWLFVRAQLLSLAAACLGKYPYLANPRISMFLGPGFVCL